MLWHPQEASRWCHDIGKTHLQVHMRSYMTSLLHGMKYYYKFLFFSRSRINRVIKGSRKETNKWFAFVAVSQWRIFRSALRPIMARMLFKLLVFAQRLHIMISSTWSCIKFRVILIFIIQSCQVMVIKTDLIIESKVANLISFD